MPEYRGLWYKGEGDSDWRQVSLHAVDAAHALEVDAEHWKVEKPEPEPVPEPEPEPILDEPVNQEDQL